MYPHTHLDTITRHSHS
uniref:Uncharacterized protein n=1 Tax=Rhizophora mucronata TaxID=61149 RepID=A0A2P2LNA5_RHIMU